jgi:ABC-type spermidine/putrescine transport system permease subunit II
MNGGGHVTKCHKAQPSRHGITNPITMGHLSSATSMSSHIAATSAATYLIAGYPAAIRLEARRGCVPRLLCIPMVHSFFLPPVHS